MSQLQLFENYFSLQTYSVLAFRTFAADSNNQLLLLTIKIISLIVISFPQISSAPTHLLTYGKDIIQLTIPENTENIQNVVQVSYMDNNVETFTSIATDQASVDKYMHKETILSRSDLKDQTSADLYRDEYLQDNKDAKQNIQLVVNSLFDIEYLHP
mgnify:CR=1 FL=1